MSYFEKVKKVVNLNIEDELLVLIILEMSRFFDSKLKNIYKSIKNNHGTVLSLPERKKIRKKFYYGKLYKENLEFDIAPVSFTNNDVENACRDCYERLNKFDQKKIINSMKKRIENLKFNKCSDSNIKDWLKIYDKKRKNRPYSLLVFVLDQNKFSKNKYDESLIIDFIRDTYDSLENYRHLAIVIEGEIYNSKDECITWNLLYKAGIYAENFISYKEKYFPFKQDKQIESLTNFLKKRNIESAKQIAEEYYDSISTGYRFEDCYVSDNQKQKILILKKIELDETPVPCPSCNTVIQRGNSYPEMFLKSFECSNPNCPDRSKSGRGKRFDEYGVYRYFKLVENSTANKIDKKTYQNWRRDVFNNKLFWLELLACEYTFENEKIYVTDSERKEYKGRKISSKIIFNTPDNAIKNYTKLPIVEFFSKIRDKLIENIGTVKLKEDIIIIYGNSSDELKKIEPNQIGTVITSPPYYNAREYSQWENMIMYFVDMLINCKTVYDVLCSDGYYLYNIGDIVSEDNIYVNSYMSKHRVQLGFLSCMIFEIAGYSLTGNLIWDKGEVQSRRNSTINLFPGYVRCINCYEHVLVFRKGQYERLSNSVNKITPVIKINNKKENKCKHTAPYPIELVELVKPYIKEGLYVLDPFLGSGTTLQWCKLNNKKGIGYELNKNYYELCKKNVRSI